MSRHAEQRVWRALTVRSRHEKVVAQNLHNRGLEAFLPLYRSKRVWSDRLATVELPLFPGYVFCRFEDAQRLLTVSTPGVASIVGFAGEDAFLEAEAINSIRQMLASGLPVEPHSYVGVGQIVQIYSGPLAGLQGTVIREKGLWRLVVNVELVQRSVAVEIGREDVQAVASLPQAAARVGLAV